MSGKIYLKFFTVATAAVATWAFVHKPPGTEPPWVQPTGKVETPLPLARRSPSSNASHAHQAGQSLEYFFKRKIVIRGLTGKPIEIAFQGSFWVEILEVKNGSTIAIARQSVANQPLNRVAIKIILDQKNNSLALWSTESSDESEQQNLDVLKDLITLWAYQHDEDTTGKYKSEIRVTKEDDTIKTWTKKKTQYLQGEARIEHSNHLIIWDKKINAVKMCSGQDQLAIGKQGLVSVSEYEIRLVKRMALTAKNFQPMDHFTHKDTLQLAISSTDRPPISVSQNWPTLRARLLRIDEASNSEQLSIFGDLTNLLRGNTALPATLLDVLNQQGWPENKNTQLFRTIVGALSSDGSAQSQQILRQLYQDQKTTPAEKGTILASMTTTQAEANADTRTFLSTVIKDESNPDLALGAAFALGSALQKAPSDAVTVRAVEQLKSLWVHGPAPAGDRLAILDAMANSGRTEFLPILLEAAAKNETDQQRAKAIFSLRLIDNQEARQAMVNALQDDSVYVRAGAASGIFESNKNEFFAAPLLTCTQQDSVAQLRAECQRALAKHTAKTAKND